MTPVPADVVLRPVQRQRRQRILDAAVALAAAGGYDAVQMREVALHADVALAVQPASQRPVAGTRRGELLDPEQTPIAGTTTRERPSATGPSPT